jgi:ribosomal protein L40E
VTGKEQALSFSGSSSYWLWIVLALVPLAIPLVFIAVAFLISLVDRAESNSLSTTAKLTCYHCGQQTAANAKTCRHCGGELQ